jgi:dihydrodipicolinate synthase/N-acetylneuraminate lyase
MSKTSLKEAVPAAQVASDLIGVKETVGSVTALAPALARAGARVILTGRTEAALHETAGLIGKPGGMIASA